MYKAFRIFLPLTELPDLVLDIGLEYTNALVLAGDTNDVSPIARHSQV
jgi:hypothetical protein